jgi:hypothetical protein
VALPHHLQLHRSLPPRDPYHQGLGEVKKAILKGSRDIPVRQAAGVHG